MGFALRSIHCLYYLAVDMTLGSCLSKRYS
jgi:hypothetical protein